MAPVRVVYLSSTPYAGSTLLSMVTNAHPDIVSVGEMGPVARLSGPDYRCSCGERLAECPFYTAIGQAFSERGLPFDPSDMDLRHRLSEHGWLNRLWMGHLGSVRVDAARNRLVAHLPRLPSELDRYALRNAVFMDAALRLSGKAVFLDANKTIPRMAFLESRPEFEVHHLHLVRDPRGVAASLHKHNGTSAGLAGRVWLRAHRQIEHVLRAVPPERKLRVLYEDFCRDPDAWFGRICRLAGVAETGVPTDFRAKEHHVVGNRMRLSADGRDTIRLDETWRERLPPGDQATVARTTRRLARSYGYDL